VGAVVHTHGSGTLPEVRTGGVAADQIVQPYWRIE